MLERPMLGLQDEPILQESRILGLEGAEKAAPKCVEELRFQSLGLRSRAVLLVTNDCCNNKIIPFAGAASELELEVGSTDSIENAFKIVSPYPEEWGMVAICLDASYRKSSLAKWVRLMRLTDHRLPISLYWSSGAFSSEEQEPTALGDSFARMPKTAHELAIAIGVAVRSNRSLGHRFAHFSNNSLPQTLHPGKLTPRRLGA